MRVFGITKGQITRAVVKFSEPPQKQPLTVCFHFPSNFLTHRYVLDIDSFSSHRKTIDDDIDDADEDALRSTGQSSGRFVAGLHSQSTDIEKMLTMTISKVER